MDTRSRAERSPLRRPATVFGLRVGCGLVVSRLSLFTQRASPFPASIGGRDRHPASENLTRMLGKGGTHHPSHFDLIPKIGPRCREPAGSILLARMRLRRPTHAARQDARGDGKNMRPYDR